MGFFDDILANVTPEDKAVFAKYPQLQQSISQMETERNNLAQVASSWAQWRQNNWDDQGNGTRKEVFLQNRVAELESQLSATPTGNTADATALKAEIDRLKNELDPARAIEGMNIFYKTVHKNSRRHFSEFNEDLDPDALMGYMRTNNINDPELAYEKMMAPKRQEIAANRQKELDLKHQEELKAAEQRGYEKRAQEVTMGPNGMLPTDGSGGISGITALPSQVPNIAKETQEQISGSKLGDGSLAALGYKMYREGAFEKAS